MNQMADIYKIPLVLTTQLELITEGDSVEEALVHVQDALAAVVGLYANLSQSLPVGCSFAIDSNK